MALEKEFFAMIFQNHTDAYCVVENHQIVWFNRRFSETFDLNDSSRISLNPDEPFFERTTSISRGIRPEMFRSAGRFEEVQWQGKRGVRSGSLLCQQVVFRDREHFIVSLVDQTERRDLEGRSLMGARLLAQAYQKAEKENAEIQAMQALLVQAGKMAALGELTTGIAHELNQPLQIIRGFAQEVQRDPSNTEGLQHIVRQVDRMSQIIQYLRGYIGRKDEADSEIDLCRVVGNVTQMMENQLRSHGIELALKCTEKSAVVRAPETQLEQVLMNLLTNARDALLSSDEPRKRIEVTVDSADKDWIRVEVTDNGPGMNSETLSRAMDPFFTTKEVGKGTGLGLSLSYGILSKLRGSLILESEIGNGTRAIVRLPKK